MGSSILIVDRQGFLGEAIFKKLPSEATTVFIDEKKKIPKIPNVHYDYIFFIQNEQQEEKDLREKIVKKAEAERARFIYLVKLSEKTEQAIEKVKNLSNKACVVVYGDLFGESPLKIENAVNKFLYQAKKNNVLKVPDSGIRKIYPVFFEDVASNILKVAFLESNEVKTFFLFPKTATTELSLAHLIQKIDPLIQIDFVKEEELKEEERIIPAKGEYMLDENYPLKKKMEDVLLSLSFTDFSNLTFHKKNSKALLLFAIYYLLFIIFSPALLIFLSAVGGIWMLGNAKAAIKKADFVSAHKYASVSKTFFSFAQKTSSLVLFEANIIGKKEAMAPVIESINEGQNIAQAVVYSLDAFADFKLVFNGKSTNPQDDFTEGLNSIKKAKIGFAPLQLFANITEVLPTVFGFNGKKTYLLLFQNNMELRPGGGFIGSYGILRMEEGRILDFTINDVYDADGQLKGHVEPPFAIRRYLPSVHWYLRDSNFSPDFVKSSEQAAFFLKQETNEAVDGVIGVDISFAKAILKATGEVYVADYKEKVNSDNLYALTQEYVQKDFFPGSTQKKDFLRSLFNAMVASLSSKKDLPYLSLLEEANQAVLQKHIIFALADKSIQNVFTVNRLSSGLWDDREESSSVVNDFLGISEANLGVNKVNHSLKRKIGQEVAISKEGSVSAKLTISYENQARENYKNYLRLILPFGAQLSSVVINGEEQTIEKAVVDPLLYEKKGFVPPNGLEVEEEEESGKTMFGFLIIIPSQSSKTVIISYALPQKPFSSAFSYSLWVFKQPGTEEDPYSFSLSYPEDFKTLKGEKPSFTKNLAEDINFKIDLVKN